MNTPMISVVMPVYNAEQYVTEAIESILNQTYSDFEFIIVDDCSTDNSYQILQSYANRDVRIKLYRNEINCKQAYTKNLAIEKTVGKYIAFMDADDISLPERFAKQIEFMETHPNVDICGTHAVAFDSENQNLYIMKVQLTHGLIKAYSLFVCCNMIHPTIIARRELFTKHSGFSFDESFGGLAEDYAMWTKMLYDGVVFANLDLVLLNYRLTSSQTTSTLKSQIEIFTKELLSDNLKRLFGNCFSLLLLEKHFFYIINASFFKSLLLYPGFYLYKRRFICSNQSSNVLTSVEARSFLDKIDPIKKVVGALKKLLVLIRNCGNVESKNFGNNASL